MVILVFMMMMEAAVVQVVNAILNMLCLDKLKRECSFLKWVDKTAVDCVECRVQSAEYSTIDIVCSFRLRLAA
jgi:hypothetical protein